MLLYLKIKKYLLLFILILVSFSFGIFISSINNYKINYNLNTIKIDNIKHNFVIEIINIAKENEDNKTFIGKLIKLDDKNIDNKILIEVLIQGNYEINNGDLLKYKSNIVKIENFNGFNYKNYMLSKDIYFKNIVYNYEIIGKNKRNFLLKKIESLKKEMINRIKILYTENEALFLSGILLGARENIPKNLSDNFNNSGLTHIIAVSGFNITIIIIFMGLMVKYLPNYLKVIIMTISIILFTLLVGYSAPVIRAAIMGIIGYLVINSGRKGDILSILIITLIIMVSFSPLSINYDVSLHLSFLAVLGIIYSQKFFENIFDFIPNLFEIRNAISLTFAAMIFTIPIMVFNFGQLSIISPISNILVMWTIPLAMLFGFLSIIFYQINYIFSIIIGYFAWILLKWDIFVVNTFGQYKYSTLNFDFGEYKYVFEILYFIVLTFLILWFKKRDEN
ncbi:MAG: ComEC/Rec2 family competence protein [Candidatus Gracilibacteria bacterium]|nr:ComEC/Rec2 family competence protein [Candidatus Gracilibacteria bacterium]